MPEWEKDGADITEKNAPNIPQFLGHYLHIQYSCHTKQAVLVEFGRDWLLFDDGGMIHTPSISLLTTTIPREKKPTRSVPLNLGDLFT